jgi:uncharacterized membrane protein YozB (DUF420 family)
MLGSAASNSVFTILGQFQVTRQYQTKGASTSKYLILTAFIGFILSIISIPFGLAFLWLTGKTQLLEVVYLITLGVIIEFRCGICQLLELLGA